MTNNKIDKDILEKGKAVIRKQLKDEGLNVQPPVFSVQSVEMYDKETDSFYTKAFIVEDMDFVRDGGLSKLNSTAYKVLKIIVAHTDKDGFSFISQEKIAEMLGISERQVGSIIREYLVEGIDKKTGQPKDVFYEGRLLLKAIKLPAPNGHKFTMYHPVNCFLDHTPYNFKDEADYIHELDADEDDGIQELSIEPEYIVDTPEAEEKKAKKEPETLDEPYVTDTAKKEQTKDNNVIDIDAFKALSEETKGETSNKIDKAMPTGKFKRGKQSQAGKAQDAGKKYAKDDTDTFLSMFN